MKKELIITRFSSPERFSRFRKEIQSGRIFLPTPRALPEDTQVLLKVMIPSNQEVFLIDCHVSQCRRDPAGAAEMILVITKDIKAVLSEMDKAVAGRRSARKSPATALSDKTKPATAPQRSTEPVSPDDVVEIDLVPGEIQADSTMPPPVDAVVQKKKQRLSFESVRDIVSQDEAEVRPETPEEVPDETIFAERELSPEERQKAQPVAQFIMNLTKAMSRSGYYDPSHPGSKKAKEGLRDEFVRVAGDSSEVAFTIKRTREEVDVMISGILADPVSARNLVGPGVAELFVPKLNDYFDRKELLSFAIRTDITSPHFDRFIDIMSDPKVDRKEFEKKGAYLTNALVESNITEISTIFADDMVSLTMKLPWRVEMAIHRLAKDLKTLPMFQGFSADAVQKLKFQTVQDIIRPLNHPRYLNDFLVNAYIISKSVESMAPADIEQIIVDAFPVPFLLPTSQYTYKELEYLNQRMAEHPDSPQILKRVQGIKRILKMIASRVLLEKAPGAQRFLEQLYQNDLLVFEELPADVQYLINTGRIADDIRDNFKSYISGALGAKTAEEILVYLKSFRRASPLFVEQGDYETLLKISSLLQQVSALPLIRSGDVSDELKKKTVEKIKGYAFLSGIDSEDILGQLNGFVFIHVIDDLISVYGTVSPASRKPFDRFVADLDLFGVDILSRVLAESEDKDARKKSFDALVRKGDLARKWAIQILNDKNRAWYVHRNAMMILRHVSQNPNDFEAVRRFVGHADARLRDEALSVAARLRPLDVEELIIRALVDDEAKIRWRAAKLLGEISPISEDAMNHLLKMLVAPVSEDKAEASAHMKLLTNLMGAINAMPEIPNKIRVETEIHRAISGVVDRGRGLVKLLKRVAGSEEESGVLKMAIPLLGRIGGAPSINFLKKLNRSHPRHSSLIKDALGRIKQRQAQG